MKQGDTMLTLVDLSKITTVIVCLLLGITFGAYYSILRAVVRGGGGIILGCDSLYR